MSLAFDGTASAQIATGVAGVHWLADLDFSGGMVRVTTAPVNVTSGGNTYTGLGSLLEVAPLSMSEEVLADKLTLSIPITSTAMLASVLGDASTYRGRAVTLWLQIFSATYAPAGAAVKAWKGYMQPARVTRKPRIDGVGSGRIELPCARSGMARARHYQGLRLTNAQQQQRYSGDKGLEYMQALIEAPTLWLSKRFQEQP